jgi:hypothetical protein
MQILRTWNCDGYPVAAGQTFRRTKPRVGSQMESHHSTVLITAPHMPSSSPDPLPTSRIPPPWIGDEFHLPPLDSDQPARVWARGEDGQSKPIWMRRRVRAGPSGGTGASLCGGSIVYEASGGSIDGRLWCCPLMSSGSKRHVENHMHRPLKIDIRQLLEIWMADIPTACCAEKLHPRIAAFRVGDQT